MKKKILFLFTLMVLVLSFTGTSAMAKSSKATKLTVSCDKLYLKVGQTRSIGVIVEPSNSTSKVKYSSSKKSVATVNKSGKIKAKKAGTTVITVKAGSCKKKIKVTVLKKGVKVKKLKFKQTKLTVDKGTVQFLSYSVKKANATTKIKWKSSNSKIVSVTQTGKITAKKQGTAKITISANGKKSTCKITVVNPKSTSGSSSGSSSSKSDNSGSSGNSTTKQDLSKLNLTVDIVYEMYSSSYQYTGEAITPLVKVYNKDLYLYKDKDYTLSYSNNVNAGTAKIKITGIGNYTGSITTTFEIKKKAQSYNASLSTNNMYIGDTASVIVTNAHGELTYSAGTEGIVEIDSKGTITAVGTGSTYIYVAASGDENYGACGEVSAGRVTVSQKDATAYGFSIGSWSSKATYKTDEVNSRQSDGSNVYTISFYCDADENWLDNNVTFEAEDVTPTAYKEMFNAMGVSCASPSLSLSSITVSKYDYVQETFTENGPGSYSVKAESGKKVTIKAGAGVRAVKLYAKKDNTVLDYVYLVSSGYNSSGNHVSFDEELYKKVREIVEKKLWDSGMTNFEKLSVMANYISETTHYPDTPTTSKTYNPTFWARWSVDDKQLYYYMADDYILNSIMKFQGGITTCTAVEQLVDVAEDLGLPNLYDGSEVADGEGVWVVTGSLSSNPTNPSHYSLKYKASDGSTLLLDAQGLGYSGSTYNAACEDHGCQEKIISLK